MKKFLIIQTAFIGDVILATPIVEKLHESCPKSTIDFLLKKGTEGLLAGHPFINNVYVWDKKNRKYLNLWKLLKAIRKEKYDYVINLHRFMSTGLLTVFSGAKQTIGFNKNPMSLFYSCRYEHIITDKNNQVHEVDR